MYGVSRVSMSEARNWRASVAPTRTPRVTAGSVMSRNQPVNEAEMEV